VKGPSGVLIATDMFGGTPSNLGLTFLAEDAVEIVTGVNLPMLIKAASLQGSARLTEVARSLREHGRNAIWVASDLLTGSTGSAGSTASAGSSGSTGSTGSAGSGPSASDD
jgi:mannose PTS system EIIA component